MKLANERRSDGGLTLLPEGLTPHKFRHTAISLWFPSGWELPRVMKQAGHGDSTTTLKIYAQVMEADPGEREKLRALIDGASITYLNEARPRSLR